MSFTRCLFVFLISLSLPISAARGQHTVELHELSESQRLLYSKAQQGSPAAQYEWANLIESGAALPYLPEKLAVDWYRLSSQQHYAPAHFKLGQLYENGTLVERSFPKAILHYELAGEAGLNEAFIVLSIMGLTQAQSVDDIDQALNYLSRAINNAKSESYGISSIVSFTTYDSTEENAVLEESAINGDAQAAFRLAERYKRGLQVAQDDEKACYWYTQALISGFAEDYEEVFSCIQQGLVSDSPIHDPIQLFAYVAKRNNYNVASFVGEHFYLPYLVEQDLELAFNYFSIAGEQNDDISLNNLGVMHRDGVVKAVDIQKAHTYFERSAKLGLDIAMYHLALSFLAQPDIQNYQQQAFKWFAAAVAATGYPPATFELAKSYLFGIGTERDTTQALQHFIEAKDGGYNDATCYILAIQLLKSPKVTEQHAGQQYLTSCPGS